MNRYTFVLGKAEDGQQSALIVFEYDEGRFPREIVRIPYDTAALLLLQAFGLSAKPMPIDLTLRKTIEAFGIIVASPEIDF